MNKRENNWDIEELIRIYRLGIENDASLGNEPNIIQKLKVLTFLSVTLFFSTYKPIDAIEMGWINGHRGYEKYFRGEKLYRVFHGTYFKNISNIRTYPSVFSFMCLRDRIKTVKEGVRMYTRRGISVGNFALWMEFFTLYSLIKKSGVRTLSTTGICDRHTTWQSHIMHLINGKFIIKQHGLVIGGGPNKLFCSKVYAYNNLEIEAFKDIIVANEDCIYETMEYVSVIDFSQVGEIGKFKVGIIAQRNPDEIKQWIKEINALGVCPIYFLMLHPTDKKRMYKNVLRMKNVYNTKRKRYVDMDLIITVDSTALYDYIYQGYSGKILRIDSSNRPIMTPEGYFGEVKCVEEVSGIRPVLIDWIKN